MGTIGNLEMRLGGKYDPLYASANHDGYKVYETITRFADFLDETKNPSMEQYAEWFKEISQELLPYQYREGLLGGYPCEVIIDVSRKLLLYNASNEENKAVSRDAIKKLCGEHEFQIFRYQKPI